MTNRDPDTRWRKRLASAYLWLGCGWAAFGLGLIRPRGDAFSLFSVIVPLAGLICLSLAFLYSIVGMVSPNGLRRSFIVPFLLAVPPVLLQVWNILRHA